MENSIKLQNKYISQKILGLNQMSLSGWEAPPEHAMNTYGGRGGAVPPILNVGIRIR